MTEEQIRPLLRVVKGNPTPEELAALVTVLTARAVEAAAAESAIGYADPAAGHRQPIRVGAGAWVASGWAPGIRTRAAW